MGILDVFKKKKDDYTNPDFGQNPLDQGQGFPDQQPFQNNAPSFGEQDPFSQQQQFPSFQNQPEQHQQGFSPEHMGFERMPPGQQPIYSASSSHSQALNEISIGKDFEIVNAKLDAIKAELDSINQRVKRIERMNEEPGAKKDQWF